jgi:flagellar basal body rod protein FlgG
MYQAAAAMTGNARWQEAISENLAAATVPGFKRTEVSFSSLAAGYVSPGEAGSQIERGMRYQLPSAQGSTAFSAGEFQATGVPTHVAIEGNGFFEVQLPNGELGYTRNGQFSVGPTGQLVTSQGFQVLSDGGAVQLDNTVPGQVSIAADGTISKGGTPRGKLRVVTFNAPNQLSAAGGGIWKSTDPALQKTDAANPMLRNGGLEGSNTSAVAEMVGMIHAMRLFEANQKVIQTQDDRMGRVISDLGGAPN